MAIDLASVRARVNDTGLFLRVSDVLAMADAIDNPGSQIPAAFVVAAAESAEPSRTIGAHRQRVTARVSVAFVLQAQPFAENRSDEVEAIRSTLKGQLAGWQPVGAETALDYVSSTVRAISRGLVWVEVQFSAAYLQST